MYKLTVFVPRSHLEKVRKAVCDAGAGHIGNYSDCTFYSEGTGTFKPNKGTRPFIGKVDKISRVKEVKLETVVQNNALNKVIKAMKTAHPYEEIAFDIIKLEKI